MRAGRACACLPVAVSCWLTKKIFTRACSGDVNPSGRLPLTFPNKENEVGFTTEQWPGVRVKTGLQSTYTEKLEVGYRWYDTHAVKPKYPFGHVSSVVPGSGLCL